MLEFDKFPLRAGMKQRDEMINEALPKDNQPVYKAEIKNKHTSGAHQITLLLMSKMAGHRIHFNIK